MTDFSQFQNLPPELADRTWQALYQTTPCRVIDVEFTDTWGSWLHVAVYGRDQNSVRDTLFEACPSSREFLQRQFVRTFSEALPAPIPLVLGTAAQPFVHPLPQEIEMDLRRDKLCISSDLNFDLDSVLGNLPDDPETAELETLYPLSKLVRLLFAGGARYVARRLTKLEVDCTFIRFFKILPLSPHHPSGVRHIKDYLPSLQKLHINCDCHRINGPSRGCIAVNTNATLEVTTKYCCSWAIPENYPDSGPDDDLESDNDSHLDHVDSSDSELSYDSGSVVSDDGPNPNPYPASLVQQWLSSGPSEEDRLRCGRGRSDNDSDCDDVESSDSGSVVSDD